MVSQQTVVNLTVDPEEAPRTTEDNDQGEKKERENNNIIETPLITENTNAPTDEGDEIADPTVQPPPPEQVDSRTTRETAVPALDAPG